MEKRQSERLLVAGSIVCDLAGNVSETQLCDLSPHGCKLAHADPAIEEGATLGLTLVGDIEIAGTVRWISGEHAGIEFREPLSQAAVLYFALPDMKPLGDISTTDGFGRRLPPLSQAIQREAS